MKNYLKEKIRDCDVVICLVGQDTHSSKMVENQGYLPYATKGIAKNWYSRCPLPDWIDEAYNSR